jgi:hypothetical protein
MMADQYTAFLYILSLSEMGVALWFTWNATEAKFQ